MADCYKVMFASKFTGPFELLSPLKTRGFAIRRRNDFHIKKANAEIEASPQGFGCCLFGGPTPSYMDSGDELEAS